MSEFLRRRVILGRSGLQAGPLGLASSYGTPAAGLEEAFDAGCNYFYWGALRRKGMAQAIRNLTQRGCRDELIVVLQVFLRNRGVMEKSLVRGLKRAGLDYADVLLLSWFKAPPSNKVMSAAEQLKKSGACRSLGMSSHHRSLFPQLVRDYPFDIFHLRYNAAHRGAEQDVFPHLPENRPGIVIFQATKRMKLAKSPRIPPGENRPSAGDCCRFVLSHPQVDVAVTAPSKLKYLQENLRHTAKGEMNPKEIAWMHRIGDYVYGPRPRSE
jgi:predicted aldo/keto reductase-like oxidoreductase